MSQFLIRYSLVNAVILLNLAMIVVALLRKKTGYLARYTTAALVWLLILSAIRVFIPLSLPNITFVINSYEIFPHIIAFLHLDIMPGSNVFEVRSLLLAIWAIGIIVMSWRILRKVRSLYILQKSYQIVDSTHENQIAQDLGMRRTNVFVSSDVSVPYITGAFKAKIYLPMSKLNDEKLKMILRHEYQHFKSGDAFIKLFYLILSIVFWWNPFIHIFLRDLDCLLEIKCDAVMSKRMTHDDKAMYLRTLIDIYRSTASNMEVGTSSNLFKAGNEKLIVQRFELLTSVSKSEGRQALSVLMVVFLVMLSFLIIIQPAYNIPYEYMDDGFFVTPDNSYIIQTSYGIYRLYVNNEFMVELTEITEPFENIPIIIEE